MMMMIECGGGEEEDAEDEDAERMMQSLATRPACVPRSLCFHVRPIYGLLPPRVCASYLAAVCSSSSQPIVFPTFAGVYPISQLCILPPLAARCVSWSSAPTSQLCISYLSSHLAVVYPTSQLCILELSSHLAVACSKLRSYLAVSILPRRCVLTSIFRRRQVQYVPAVY